MVVAGIDIGSLTGKIVLFENPKIIDSVVINCKRTPRETVDALFELITPKTGIKKEDIEVTVGTGYGRRKIPTVGEKGKTISELTCHGRGAFWCNSNLRTIIDIGGQDCKVIKIDERGNMKNFVMNDKCAAGTGRYLEIMAETLKVTLDELGPLALKAKSPISIMNQCSVFAHQEVIQLINDGVKKEQIAAGISKAMAERVAMLANKVVVEEEVAISGGVAKNQGIVNQLEKILKIKFKPFPVDPQIIGALGAATIAQELSKKYKNN
ncbi:MAG: acyl-CoA dehydratase activase [Candidatus Helarchaeota archaeon]